MEEKKGLKEIKELFAALDLIAKTAGAAYKDKKIDMSDLPLVIDLAINAKVLMDAFAGLSEAAAEANDLDPAEQLLIVTEVLDVAKKYEDARNS
jgi:hypothetical protein